MTTIILCGAGVALIASGVVVIVGYLLYGRRRE